MKFLKHFLIILVKNRNFGL